MRQIDASRGETQQGQDRPAWSSVREFRVRGDPFHGGERRAWKQRREQRGVGDLRVDGEAVAFALQRVRDAPVQRDGGALGRGLEPERPGGGVVRRAQLVRGTGLQFERGRDSAGGSGATGGHGGGGRGVQGHFGDRCLENAAGGAVAKGDVSVDHA